MNIFLILILTVFIVFLIVKCIVSLTLKIIGVLILVLALLFTVNICCTKPEIHKPLSLETIEYLLKVNKDGSLTTTKQVSRRVLKKEAGK